MPPRIDFGLTSDNPRREDPERILDDMESGLAGRPRTWVRETDRGRAIRRRYHAAEPGDTVLVAGKGHERTQSVGGRTVPFDDRDVCRAALHELGYTLDETTP